MKRLTYLSSAAALLISAAVATAGTQVKGSIVPHNASGHPQVSQKSTFGMKGTGDYKVGLKGITDGGGAPAGPTSGSTPDTQYWLVFKGDTVGVVWQYNVPFNIAKAGQAKIQGSAAGLLGLTPTGTATGVLGVEVHAPTTAGDAAACTAVLGGVMPGIYIGATGNPCASGARLGLTGIVTGQ
ncbi:MAG: hypothetical protein U0807_00565 [Candidatus Binatia bacterium]